MMTLQRMLEDTNNGIQNALREEEEKKRQHRGPIMLERLDGTMTKMMTMKNDHLDCNLDKDDGKEQKENSIISQITPAKKQQKEVTHDMNTESSNARRVPVRRLSRNSSAKLTSSFRGGSLKNVMEDVEVDDSSLIEVVLTELRPTRRLSRGNSAKSLGKKSGSKRRVAPSVMSSLDDNSSLLPARRLSRGNSARNGSFRGGSLRNVLEDKEADMAPLDDDMEENVKVPGERRRSYPPGNRTNSFRTNSLRSMRLYNSTSSLSSCASSSELYKDRNSIDINDFGVEHRYYHETSSEDVSASSASKSIFADSDGFIGWGGNFSSKNIHIELNPTKFDKRSSPATMGPTSLKRSDSRNSCTSDLADSQGFLNWVNNGDSSSRTLSHGSNDGAAVAKTDIDSQWGINATLPLAAELKRPSSPKKLFGRRLSSFGGNEEKKEFYEDTKYTIAPRAKPSSGSTNNILNRLSKSLRSSLSNSSSGELNTMSTGSGDRRFRHSTGDVSRLTSIRINREDDVDILELRRELCAAANTKSKRKSFKDVFF